MDNDKSANGRNIDRNQAVKGRQTMTLDPEPYLHELSRAVAYVVAQEDTLARNVLGEFESFEWFGKLATFDQTEREHLSAMRDLIVRYLTQKSASRPLSLAIFGPPGSGKSTAVREIQREIQDNDQIKQEELELPNHTINLTQLSDTRELGRAIARVAGEQRTGTIPIVFFDEFDASRDGADYGWLSWFLSPMQDGEILHEGALVRLSRAIYVFAGGTVSSMAEFSDLHNLAGFRAAKGPDFISRLRGFLDVAGPNAEPKMLRRAIILRKQLADRAARSGAKPYTLNKNLVESLLTVGRYRHGARSIAALVEVSDLGSKTEEFDWSRLPKDHLLDLHIDRGPLDAKRIGGEIAIYDYSGLEKKRTDKDPVFDGNAKAIWEDIGQALWREGACLSVASKFSFKDLSAQLRDSLLQKIRQLPIQLTQIETRRQNAPPWLLWFESTDGAVQSKTDDYAALGLQIISKNYLSTEEKKNDSLWKDVVCTFRQQLLVGESSVALVVMLADNHSGSRVPRAIEAMTIMLAMGKPIYVVCGGREDAGVGSLLGLVEIPDSKTADWVSNCNDQHLSGILQEVRPPQLPDFPVLPSEVAAFLRRHAIGSTKWPSNGLSLKENRYIFHSYKHEEVRNLILKGLKRVFAR